MQDRFQQLRKLDPLSERGQRHWRWLSWSLVCACLLLWLPTAFPAQFVGAVCAQSASYPTITREEIIARAASWLNHNIRYSQQSWNLVDPGSGTRYRQDCSGYVSYAWRGSQRWTTVQLGQDLVTHAIEKDDLRIGDIINNKAPGNAGHVVIFHRWENDQRTEYWGYDFSPAGIQYRKIKYPFNDKPGFEPRRYNHVCTEDARYIAQSGYPTVQPGQHFQIWFELENSGTCPWRGDHGYRLLNTNSLNLGAPQSMALSGEVGLGKRYRWVIDMVAPNTPGEYITEWRMAHNEHYFGVAPWIRVTVAATRDNDNRPETANWLTAGASQTHSLMPASDEDWFTFTLDTRSSIVLRTAGQDGDTRLWLYDGNLVERVFNDDDGNSYFSRIVMDCAAGGLASGRYYARVNLYDATLTLAEYTIYLLSQPCTDDNREGQQPEPVAPMHTTVTRYRVAPSVPTCGGIIMLEFTPARDARRIDFAVVKCDLSPIQKDGRLYIAADTSQRYGPINYAAGAVAITGSFDPVGDLGLTGEHSYTAHLYPHGQDSPIISGTQRAWTVSSE